MDFTLVLCCSAAIVPCCFPSVGRTAPPPGMKAFSSPQPIGTGADRRSSAAPAGAVGPPPSTGFGGFSNYDLLASTSPAPGGTLPHLSMMKLKYMDVYLAPWHLHSDSFQLCHQLLIAACDRLPCRVWRCASLVPLFYCPCHRFPSLFLSLFVPQYVTM